jgi:outer membrane protein assembly factor BamB
MLRKLPAMLHARRLVFLSLLVGASFAQAIAPVAIAEDWPQWRGPNRDGVWNETGIVEKFATSELKPKWRVEVVAGSNGPTVAAGRVYVMDRITQPQSTERVHCFDEQTGEQLWSHAYACDYGSVQYQAGPRASVTVHDGKAFAIGATGRIHCFGAANGEVAWHRDLEAEYQIDMPIWGIAASPLVFEDKIILQIGGRGACIVALNRDTGKEAWRALADRAQYSSPVLIEQAGQQVAVCWTGDSVAGIAASDGKVLWRHVWTPREMPIGVATPVVEKDRVFFTSFYDGSLMLQIPAERAEFKVLWHEVGRNEQNTLALHSIISTPVFEKDHIYGVDSYGELRCLDARDGSRLWEDKTATPPDRWSNIHFVKNGDRYFLFNERGELLIARLSPQGFEEISRAKLIEPTRDQLPQRRGGVCWSHPAFANQHVFARNDKELVCASLAE